MLKRTGKLRGLTKTKINHIDEVDSSFDEAIVSKLTVLRSDDI